MRKITIISFTLCFICSVAFGQQEEIEDSYSVLSTDSAYTEIGLMPEVLDQNVKALLESWHVQYFSKAQDYCLDDSENVDFPENIYQQRLAQLPCVIPMTYNQTVRNCIDLYAGRRRDLVRYMMGMADLYFPIFEQILDEYELPLELKYLAVVESALNPTALSRVGAAGLWQFMLPTGKIYGLEINSLVDERLDVYKATHAACKYFKEMYAVYGDWHLVLASYNCGPGNVNKAIRRSGGKTDFWAIYPNLPKETRSYVPLFIAATYVMNYHCEHNLCPMETSLSMASDTFIINKMLHLQQVSEVLNVDYDLLKTLNPQYKREIVPGNIRPSVLKLPLSAAYSFIDNEDSLYMHRIEELLANCVPADSVSEDGDTREKIRHTVKSGENLYTIANQYGVTAQNIRRWNQLKSNRVPVGRKLTIHIDNGGIAYAAKTSETSSSEKEKDVVIETSTKQVAEKKVSTAAQTTKKVPDTNSKLVSYKVQSGDSLYSISKKYPGVTVAQIQSANNMSNSKIRVGQVIKIPVG
ncbi:MAG: LysM peptidoglycan-binding domain-containing protein [Tannerella sp.]|jgi:membrane-bound lytic murein transglycosylase D|nr:LysM peptidoglycan-binding domain-containing protein [Tannerella sp.]